MRKPGSRIYNKKTIEPVTITPDNKFNPKVSQRTIKRQEEIRQRRLKAGHSASGLDTCGIVCLYIFLVLAVLIGGGGTILCGVYFNTNTDSQGWKIAGIVLGILTCILGVILILLTIFKQTRNRRWRYKKEEEISKIENSYANLDDDDESDTDYVEENQMNKNSYISPYAIEPLSVYAKAQEIATSPMPEPSPEPKQTKTEDAEMIFCPGCNRTHPSTHQCMYSTRIANTLATRHRPPVHLRPQDSIAIQTEENEDKTKKSGPHTVIDRTFKYSQTTETQTDVSANPRANITESIILRRVPVPTAKVVVQQPTTKVMIVKVPNVAGQLIIQPKAGLTDEQPK